MDVAKSIKDKERSGISRVQVIEKGSEGNEDKFWKLLGGKPEKIATAKEGMEDAEAEKVEKFHWKFTWFSLIFSE